MQTTLKTHYTAKEAADAIGVCPRRVRQMIEDGELKSLVVGQVHLIPRRHVEKELARREKPDGLTVPQAAAKLRLTESRVRLLVRTGRLEGVTHRGKVYVNEGSVASYDGD